MAHRVQKEINDITKKRAKCLDRGDYAEAAKLCNAAGELLSRNGLFKEAYEYHKDEVTFSEVIHDRLGEAVGHRKMGECLCDLGDFSMALFHQRKHLEYARQCGDLTEEQRALATIGRTFYLQYGAVDTDACLVESQQAFLQSLSVCDKLKGIVSEKEILEMRSRLYLNLGLVFEAKEEYSESIKFIQKALVTSSEFKLRGTMFRCHFSLSHIFSKMRNQSGALQNAKRAQQVARDVGDHSLEAEAWVQLGQILLSLGDFRGFKDALQKAYKLSPPLINQDTDNFVKSLKMSLAGDVLLDRLSEEESLEEKFILFEKLGDIYSKFKALTHALDCYTKQLEIGIELNKDEKILASVCVSLAITYAENKEYEQSIAYYDKELKLSKNENKENASTYCAIAKVQEDAGYDVHIIRETYRKALSCAKKCKKASVQLSVYQELMDTLLKNKLLIEAKEIEAIMENLSYELENTCIPDEDDSKGNEKEEDWMMGIVDLDKLLCDHDEESDEDEGSEGVVNTSGKRKGSSNRSASKRKVQKVNEKGETPLHTVCILGRHAEVVSLIKMGADLSARDHCGWQPLHEAANHGHDDIVKELILAGACVNDPGGKHCQGLTPLHDAAQNGHLSTVKLLVLHGADTGVKDAFGNTPLQMVLNAIKAQEDEEVQESEMLQDRRDVVSYLKTVSAGSHTTCDVRRRDIMCRTDEEFTEPEASCDKVSTGNKRNDDVVTAPDHCIVLNEWSDHEDDWQFPDEISSDSDSNYASMDDEDANRKTKNCASRDKNESYSHRRKPEEKLRRRDAKQEMIFISQSEGQRQLHNAIDQPAPSCRSRNSSLDGFIVDDTGSTKRNFNTLFSGNRRKMEAGRGGRSKDIRSVKKQNPCRFNRMEDSVEEPRNHMTSNHSTVTSTNKRSYQSKLPVITNSTNSKSPSLYAQSLEMIRIRVKILDKVLLIPCPNDSSIRWLLDEINNRYKSPNGEGTVESVCTLDGAILHADDKVVHVLEDNAQVVATVDEHIQSAAIPCKETTVLGSPVLDEIMVYLQISDAEEIQINDEYFTPQDIKHLSKALRNNPKVTSLNLKGCCLQTYEPYHNYEILQDMMKSSVFLQNLVSLDLSCSGLHKGFEFLNELLEQGISGGRLPLQKLEKLDLSYNLFPSNTHHILFNLLQTCSSLRSLSLEHCNLHLSSILSHNDFTRCFEGLRHLKTLNIAGNYLFSKQGSSGVFEFLMNTKLEYLNLSDFQDEICYEEEFLVSIISLLNKLQSTLVTLDISGCMPNALKNASLNAKFWDAISRSNTLKVLHLSNNILLLDTVKTLANSLPLCKCLTTLNMTGVKSFNNECLDELLHILINNRCSLKKLVLASTSVCSPLPEGVYNLLTESQQLDYVDFSDCGINDIEKNKLVQQWKHCQPGNESIVSPLTFVLLRPI